MSIPIFTPLRKYSRFFRSHTVRNWYALLAVMILVGLTESFGISLFLPLLSQFSAAQATAPANAITGLYQKFSHAAGIPDTPAWILCFIAVVFMVKFLIQAVQALLSAHISRRFSYSVRTALIDALSKMRYEHYLRSNTGTLTSLAGTESIKVTSSITYFFAVLTSLVYIFIYLAFSFIFDWKISLLAISLGGLLFWLLRSLTVFARVRSREIAQLTANLQHDFIQFLHHYKYLKGTDRADTTARSLEHKTAALEQKQYGITLLRQIQIPLPETLTILLTLGLIFFQSAILHRDLTVALIVFALFYRTVGKITSFQSAWQNFCTFIGSIDMLNDALKELPGQAEPKGSIRIEGLHQELRCRNVSYETAGKPILTDISLVIPKNTTVALVGESGAGKTTLLNLLLGLLHPQRGELSVDGIPYTSLDYSSLRRITGYVTQEGAVFNDTIANNVSMYECDLSDDTCRQRVTAACAKAGFDATVRTLDKGYDTMLGERGLTISGGQRQRLAIARELFRDPQILIFDEATSSLDRESEIFIQQNIQSLHGGKTMIIVTHQLSTIKHCDYVYVLREGRIAEEGKFEDLSSRPDSLLARMCRIQNA